MKIFRSLILFVQRQNFFVSSVTDGQKDIHFCMFLLEHDFHLRENLFRYWIKDGIISSLHSRNFSDSKNMFDYTYLS